MPEEKLNTDAEASSDHFVSAFRLAFAGHPKLGEALPHVEALSVALQANHPVADWIKTKVVRFALNPSTIISVIMFIVGLFPGGKAITISLSALLAILFPATPTPTPIPVVPPAGAIV